MAPGRDRYSVFVSEDDARKGFGYYLSDSPDGASLSPTFEGSLPKLVEEIEESPVLWIVLVVVALLVLIAIWFFIFRRKGTEGGIPEE